MNLNKNNKYFEIKNPKNMTRSKIEEKYNIEIRKTHLPKKFHLSRNKIVQLYSK